jgi:hypothetical protein
LSFIQINDLNISGEIVSMAGLKPSIVNNLYKRNMKIISCVDNDESGIKFNLRISKDEKFANCFTINSDCSKSKVKDFNELLQKLLSPQSTKNADTPILNSSPSPPETI